MTTANESGGSRHQTFLNQYAHLQPLLWVLTAAADVWALLGASPLAMKVEWIVTMALWLSFYASHRHARSLCEKCAFLTPLNTDVAVEHNIRWLRGLHWVIDHPGKALLSLLVLLATVWIPFTPLKVTGTVVLDLVLGAFVLCELKHRVLAPWCPMCRWGGGGDEEFVPEPAPPPQITADR